MTHRDTSLFPSEMKEINEIVDGQLGDMRPEGEAFSIDTYLFNTKLKKLKEFCEYHIKIYFNEIINPAPESKCMPYITQSWLSVIEPGKNFHRHSHCNSIISGVFYIATTENDSIDFYDINAPTKMRLNFLFKEQNHWTADAIRIKVINNDLILFPSWVEHSVPKNETSTTRISLSFNVFAKGKLGSSDNLTELNLT